MHRIFLLPLGVRLGLLALLVVAEQQEQELVLDQGQQQLDHGKLQLIRSKSTRRDKLDQQQQPDHDQLKLTRDLKIRRWICDHGRKECVEGAYKSILEMPPAGSCIIGRKYHEGPDGRVEAGNGTLCGKWMEKRPDYFDTLEQKWFEAERKRQQTVKLLKAWVCKELPESGKICSIVGKKEECAQVVERMDLWMTCKTLGITERCEIDRNGTVCTEEESPKLCADVIEHTQKNSTEKEEGRNKRLWKTKIIKTATIGTEELCAESQELWQECSVDNDGMYWCLDGCDMHNDHVQDAKCHQDCAISHEKCTNLQEKEALKRIKDKKCNSSTKCIEDTDCGENGTCSNGVNIGKCDCLSPGCVNKEKCYTFHQATNARTIQCGGLMGACNNTINECDCEKGYMNAGFKGSNDAQHNFCGKKQCVGIPRRFGAGPLTMDVQHNYAVWEVADGACFGYPCKTGHCVCGVAPAQQSAERSKKVVKLVSAAEGRETSEDKMSHE